MGIFSNIMGKIFPTEDADSPQTIASITDDVIKAATPVAAPVNAPTQMVAVDVEAILDAMQQNSGQKLNWQTSIVDLLKLLGLDSSLDARKKLAAELNYNGDTNDSASMNIWLHKEVMKKIAANGGKLPTDIKL